MLRSLVGSEMCIRDRRCPDGFSIFSRNPDYLHAFIDLSHEFGMAKQSRHLILMHILTSANAPWAKPWRLIVTREAKCRRILIPVVPDLYQDEYNLFALISHLFPGSLQPDLVLPWLTRKLIRSPHAFRRPRAMMHEESLQSVCAAFALARTPAVLPAQIILLQTAYYSPLSLIHI